MKKKTWIICIGAALFIAFSIHTYRSSPNLPSAFAGTYLSGTGAGQLQFVVENEKFYYADQNRGNYIRGELHAVGENQYALSCPNPDSAALIPDQTITCEDLTFQANIGGEEVLFEKSDAYPVFVRAPSDYT